MTRETISLALAVGELAVARRGPSGIVATTSPADELPQLAEALEAERPRWVWWSAEQTAAPLVAAGVQLAACWDLAAVHRLLVGGRRDDPAAVEAAVQDRPVPPPLDASLTLLRRDGSAAEVDEPSVTGLAVRALAVQRAQEALLAGRPDPRPGAPAVAPPLAVLTAHAESAAALLAVELGQHGLPLSRPVAEQLLQRTIGPAGSSAASRDAEVLRHFLGTADLRNPLQVRELLRRNGFDVPDTRSWRLEPLRSSPGIAALLGWRKVERVATTYGWGWLDDHVRAGRLRGRWVASDGAGGRMTASAGLHNLPAELRGCVVADPGHVFVRADLGQIEPRVLAVVSGDPGLVAATGEQDMYAPVARQLGIDRPTAKIAVLAAMYGQTSGPAAAALARMKRAYPMAIDHLQQAEDRGRAGLDVQTYGGRRVPMGGPAPADPARGRYARNAVVQGAAAEFFKAWAATVRAGLSAYEGRIVLCLHDELLVHVPEQNADAAAALLQDALVRTAHWWAAGSGVRFVAVVTRGRTWADATE